MHHGSRAMFLWCWWLQWLARISLLAESNSKWSDHQDRAVAVRIDERNCGIIHVANVNREDLDVRDDDECIRWRCKRETQWMRTRSLRDHPKELSEMLEREAMSKLLAGSAKSRTTEQSKWYQSYQRLPKVCLQSVCESGVSVEMAGGKDPVVTRRTWFEANPVVVINPPPNFPTGGKTGTRRDFPIFYSESALTRDGRCTQCTAPYALLHARIHSRTCVLAQAHRGSSLSVAQRVISSSSACHVCSLSSLHLHDVPHFHSHIRMTHYIKSPRSRSQNLHSTVGRKVWPLDYKVTSYKKSKEFLTYQSTASSTTSHARQSYSSAGWPRTNSGSNPLQNKQDVREWNRESVSIQGPDRIHVTVIRNGCLDTPKWWHPWHRSSHLQPLKMCNPASSPFTYERSRSDGQLMQSWPYRGCTTYCLQWPMHGCQDPFFCCRTPWRSLGMWWRTGCLMHYKQCPTLFRSLLGIWLGTDACNLP